MLENMLSRSMHFVLSLIIPLLVSFLLGASSLIMILACGLSWAVYKNTEIEIIQRHGNYRKIPITSMVSFFMSAGLSFSVLYIGYYILDIATYGWVVTMFRTVGLSMSVMIVIAIMYNIGTTYYCKNRKIDARKGADRYNHN